MYDGQSGTGTQFSLVIIITPWLCILTYHKTEESHKFHMPALDGSERSAHIFITLKETLQFLRIIILII
jgi:hypothetical protein